MNSFWLYHFSRFFSHGLVALSLALHQLMFQPFVDLDLYIYVYSLCFFALAVDSFYLFFHKDNQKDLTFYFLFIEAVFLSLLVLILGPPGLFFVFILAFIQSAPLIFSGKIFESLVFALSLALFLPLAFLREESLSQEDRLSLSVLSYAVLGSLFCFGWLFHFISKNFIAKDYPPEGDLEALAPIKPAPQIGLSLDLARKLQPVLNDLTKYFPDKTKPEGHQSVSSHFFSAQSGKQKLERMRNFILDFIDYAEPLTESLMTDVIDLKQLVQKTLKKLESQPQRPENLIQTTNWPEELKVKGSAEHLKKCFERILINSFEALKNQERKTTHIRGWTEKDFVALEFSDNGHGIDSEDMKKIFNPLFSNRLELMRGLGLPYIQKIIKAHKAKLDIKSQPNKGTALLIKFPLIYDLYDGGLKPFKARRHKKAA